MKILVYGAGVLGSLYAWRLKEAGHEVALLGRGQRLADLRQHGLVLEDMVTGQRATAAINLVEQLKPDEAYDLVLVMMGKHQVGSTLPSLAANRHTPNVLFMGNNAAGPDEMVAALGPERVIQGFPLAGGTIKDHVVYYAAGLKNIPARAVIGELDGCVTPRLQQIAAAFKSAGFDTSYCPNMDAWLKTHAMTILPLGAAYYGAGLDAGRMSRTRDALVLVVRAIREGLAVLRAWDIPILPPRQKIFAWLPEPLLVFMLSRMLQKEIYQYALAHAPHMRPELQRLAADFQALRRAKSVPTPSMDRLCSLVDPSTPPIPEGSTTIPLDWRSVWAGLAVLGGLLFGLVWVRRQLMRPSADSRRLGKCLCCAGRCSRRAGCAKQSVRD